MVYLPPEIWRRIIHEFVYPSDKQMIMWWFGHMMKGPMGVRQTGVFFENACVVVALGPCLSLRGLPFYKFATHHMRDKPIGDFIRWKYYSDPEWGRLDEIRTQYLNYLMISTDNSYLITRPAVRVYHWKRPRGTAWSLFADKLPDQYECRSQDRDPDPN